MCDKRIFCRAFLYFSLPFSHPLKPPFLSVFLKLVVVGTFRGFAIFQKVRFRSLMIGNKSIPKRINNNKDNKTNLACPLTVITSLYLSLWGSNAPPGDRKVAAAMIGDRITECAQAATRRLVGRCYCIWNNLQSPLMSSPLNHPQITLSTASSSLSIVHTGY